MVLSLKMVNNLHSILVGHLGVAIASWSRASPD